jgi:hypothetical protein
MKTISPQYSVSYISGVTGNRKCIHLHTKTQALKEAQQLHREGAKFIDSFKYTPGLGAISFNWRKF